MIVDPDGGWGFLVTAFTTAGSGASGYAIDRYVFGGDGRTRAAIGFGIGAGVGLAGVSSDWGLPSFEGFGNGIWNAFSALGNISTLATATNNYLSAQAFDALMSDAQPYEKRVLYGNAAKTIFSESSHIQIVREGNRPDPDAGIGLSSGGEEYIPFWGA